MNNIDNLCDSVRTAGFSLHKYLRHGHSEKVYENGLKHRLEIQGLKIQQQHPISVRDEDGFALGDFYADLLVENKILVELKAVRATNADHVAHVIGYLRATDIEYGLLINFGAPKFSIKRYILT